MTLPYANYIDLLRPDSKRFAVIYDCLMILGGSLLLAVASRISVMLPFSPIPITAQTLAVLLIGTTMGSKRGALTILAYLAEGAAGLPVLAGGLSGITYMLGPTGGYLIGFVAAAYVIGLGAEKGYDRNVITTFLMLTVGTVAIYIFGLLWLSIYIERSLVLSMGLYPFIPGAVLKIVMASLALPAGWALMGKNKR